MQDVRVPDGGYGWVIVFACFIANFLLVGMPRSFGVIYVVLLERFHCGAMETAWAHAIFNTLRMVFGPLSSVACERFSCRKVVVFGGLLLGAGVMCMAFATNIYWVYATYGALAGFGGAFIFTPTLIVTGHYFNKKKGVAMAITTLGSGMGTFIFAPLFTYLFATYGYFGATLLIGAIMLHCVIAGALLRPVKEYLKPTVLTVNCDTCGGDTEQTVSQTNVCDNCLRTGSGKTPIESETYMGGQTLIESETYMSSDAAETLKEESDLAKPLYPAADKVSLQNVANYTPCKEVQTAHFEGESEQILLQSKETDDQKRKQSQMEKRSIHSKISASGHSRSRFSSLCNLTFVLYNVNIMCMPFCIQTVYLFLPRYAQENNMDKSTSAWIVAAMGITSTVGRCVFGVLFDLKSFRYRRRFLHSIVGIFFGLSSSGIGIWQGFWPVAVFCTLGAFFEGGFHGQRATVLSEMVPLKYLATSVGYMIFTQGIGNTICPISGGLIRDYTGAYDLVFLVGGVVFALTSFVMLLDYLCFAKCKRRISESEREH